MLASLSVVDYYLYHTVSACIIRWYPLARELIDLFRNVLNQPAPFRTTGPSIATFTTQPVLDII